MKRTVSIGMVIFILALFSLWLVIYNGQHRAIFKKTYTFTEDGSKTFKHHPRFLFLYGLSAWFQNDPVTAARFFRQAVLQDVLYIDAWIWLSQTELLLGHEDNARGILTFMQPLTENIYRWKWRQTLLAYDLGIAEMVVRNINFLLSHNKMTQDAFQLLDTHVSKNIAETIEALHKDNLRPLLEWLMSWGRVEDAEKVWNIMNTSVILEKDIFLKYIHFLINNKRVNRAAEIWRTQTGIEGLTNAGFENDITGRGFDWRYTPDNDDKWTIRRTTSISFAGEHSLKIVFEGKENISFAHLYQIARVDPLKTYRLTYSWRSRDISTDQGPFIDIYGYDCKGFYFKGPMIYGTNDWKEQDIEFTVPENCQSIVIRLRRQRSQRFDNKLAGTLWLDNFGLQELHSPI
ncbi:MAG: hypothetical protein JSV38_05450 [Desulfobacterales bacterium]|nr:MAG: hypothetical protein JSV38_05450 [Desulfobacterales bacterium]